MSLLFYCNCESTVTWGSNSHLVLLNIQHMDESQQKHCEIVKNTLPFWKWHRMLTAYSYIVGVVLNFYCRPHSLA